MVVVTTKDCAFVNPEITAEAAERAPAVEKLEADKLPVTELFPADVNPPAPMATGPEGFVNVNGAVSLFAIDKRLFAVILNS